MTSKKKPPASPKKPEITMRDIAGEFYDAGFQIDIKLTDKEEVAITNAIETLARAFLAKRAMLRKKD